MIWDRPKFLGKKLSVLWLQVQSWKGVMTFFEWFFFLFFERRKYWPYLVEEGQNTKTVRKKNHFCTAGEDQQHFKGGISSAHTIDVVNHSKRNGTTLNKNKNNKKLPIQ